jgi:hypothetical protein
MRKLLVFKAVLAVCLFGQVSFAQTTEFTYQGRLLDSSLPATGSYDFEFSLWDSLVSGTQQGSTITVTGVSVTAGIFTVKLDFGLQFPGAARFLEIAVKPSGPGAFTPLAPRQPITSGPYAIRSLNSGAADSLSASCVGCVTASQIGSVNGSAVTGTIPVASVPAGSGNYIQNQNAGPQPSSDFNISGTGTANIFDVATQYNIGGSRILAIPGTANLFAGAGAGASNTTGSFNAFLGGDAGLNNTTGFDNTFVGQQAGLSNTTGSSNAFFGRQAGQANNSGSANTFLGTSAGQANTTGVDNAFVGASAGFSNTTGSGNAFFGRSAGFSNSTGDNNAFFGTQAGQTNTSGFDNAFFGRSAGFANTTGIGNAFFGTRAGQANTTAINNAFFGTGAGQANTTGDNNAFFGRSAGLNNATGDDNTFAGTAAGIFNTLGARNAFFGRDAGRLNTTGTNNTAVGQNADFSANNLTFATAIGSGAIATANNQVQLGRNGLDTVSIGALAAATSTQLCINGTVIAACSSSARYKENIRPFVGGLNLVNRLRPVTYDWTERKEADLGLIAEEVEKVEPLLVTYNEKGEIQGVKYDQITLALINAVREQQLLIERQQKQIDALKRLICKKDPTAEGCKEEK